ncbi:MAG: succinate dehydrogenase, hydrophobic membrane anchor protein [Chloroflexi bacterium]|nr:succinate dehydrogenase, hydrophobic membrane anchor protein [Chloroflexota bacterium]
MAIQTPERPKTALKEPTKRSRWTRTGARPRPTNAFELYSWYFFRVSGILLLVFALTHLVVMHLINNVEVINYDFVRQRWASPLWRTFDLLLLFLALTHGMNGVRTLIYDYVQSKGWRVFNISVLYIVGIFFLLIGAQVIITFNPNLPSLPAK